MLDILKQIFEANHERIRSPFIGWIAVVFVGANWQSLFYLFYAEELIQNRIMYFNENTSTCSIYIIPFVFGVFFAIAMPWITLGGAKLAKYPKFRLYSLQKEESKEKLIVKDNMAAEVEVRTRHVKAKAKLEEVTERSKIDAAKRLKEAKDIGDGQVARDIIEARSGGKYVSPELKGTVTFDYSNNNGIYVVGAGDMLFETHWSRASNTSIHAYSNTPSIKSVALADGVENIQDITNARDYDTSSRIRSPHLDQIVIWQNIAGYFLATRIEKLNSRSHGDQKDSVTFSYIIEPTNAASFEN